MHRISAGPSWAPMAWGVIVENSAAWPASTRMVRSPSSSTMVPDKTVNQSLPMDPQLVGAAPGRRLGDAHFGHGHAVRPGFAGQHPGGHPPHHVALWPDHHVVVVGGLH